MFNFSAKTPLDQYKSPANIAVTDTILTTQNASGGWSKNGNTSDLPDTLNYYTHSASTFDNGATTNHLRFLLRAFAVGSADKDVKIKHALDMGLRYILDAQLNDGSWPQNYPNTSSYGGFSTINDSVMVSVIRCLLDFAHFNPFNDREIKRAISRGLDFILASQLEYKGWKTGWAQQYDQGVPARGRVYELPAAAVLESVKVIQLLRSLDDPVYYAAAEDAAAWVRSVTIPDYTFQKVDITPFEYERKFVSDIRGGTPGHIKKTITYKKELTHTPGASLWARFYDVEENVPIFSDWSGQKKYNIHDVDPERLIGYSWYGTWGSSL